MFDELNIKEFVDKVSSSDPVPGGGSVSALAGSLAAALSSMVAGLTIGKKKYLEVEEEMILIKEKADKLKNKLYEDIQNDSEAFNLVMDAFKMPKNSEEEKTIRKAAIQSATKKASLVPLDVAYDCLEIIKLADTVVERGNKNAVTDGAVSAMLAKTAVLGALLNVKINLGGINDESFVKDIENKVLTIEKEAVELENKVVSKVIL